LTTPIGPPRPGKDAGRHRRSRPNTALRDRSPSVRGSVSTPASRDAEAGRTSLSIQRLSYSTVCRRGDLRLRDVKLCVEYATRPSPVASPDRTAEASRPCPYPGKRRVSNPVPSSSATAPKDARVRFRDGLVYRPTTGLSKKRRSSQGPALAPGQGAEPPQRRRPAPRRRGGRRRPPGAETPGGDA